LLILGSDDILFEVTGENKDVVSHSLKDLDPLLGLEGDTVDVADASDYDADFHTAKLPFSGAMQHLIVAVPGPAVEAPQTTDPFPLGLARAPQAQLLTAARSCR